MEEYSNSTALGSFEIPPVAIYCKMFLLFVAPLAVIIPSGLVVRVIVKQAKLHTKYYFILVFLLATDAVGIILENSTVFTGISIYLADVDVAISCVFLRILKAPQFASQLMFVVLGIDRFIAIAFPFHHKEIVTTKFACGMIAVIWMLTVVIYAVVLSVTDFVYIPQFAECTILKGFPFMHLIKQFMLLMSTALIVAINIYLYYKILETKRKHQNYVHGCESQTTSKLDALRKRLREHVKPTVSILLLGGIDGLFNIVIVLMYPLARVIFGNNSMTRLYLLQFLVLPLRWIQLISRPLVYGIYMANIRKKLCDFNWFN